MLTTQVTLANQQTQALRAFAQRTGKTEADIIVEAVGQFLAQQALHEQLAARRQVTTPGEESDRYASLDFWDNLLDDEDWNNA
jgi:hypothetical protein